MEFLLSQFCALVIRLHHYSQGTLRAGAQWWGSAGFSVCCLQDWLLIADLSFQLSWRSLSYCCMCSGALCFLMAVRRKSGTYSLQFSWLTCWCPPRWVLSLCSQCLQSSSGSEWWIPPKWRTCSWENEGKSEQPWRWTVDHVSFRRMTVSVNLRRGVVSLEISSCLSFSGCAAKPKIVCITVMWWSLSEAIFLLYNLLKTHILRLNLLVGIILIWLIWFIISHLLFFWLLWSFLDYSCAWNFPHVFRFWGRELWSQLVWIFWVLDTNC